MDTPRKVIVGYDLCEDYSQICCYSYKSFEPLPISLREGEEDGPIPTVLCLKTDTKQWLFGDEAVSCAKSGAGILVDQLLSKVRNNEEIELLDMKIGAVALLEKFIRKTLTLVKNYFPTEPITKLVVTVRNTQPELVDKIYAALALLGIERDRAMVISHASSYLYYALSQDKSLWMNDVGLFDFSADGLLYYQIKTNRRIKPMVAGLTKTDFSDNFNVSMLKQNNSNAAYIFENIANTALYKQIVSTLYFTGSGFEGGWADDIIKGLCMGRRIFFGQNLYTKGACYAAKEFAGDKLLSDILLLNDDMITSTVSARVYCDTKFTEALLAQAGAIWFEVDHNIEVIPEGAAELEIVLKNVMNRDIIREKLVLNQFPERPDRTTRLMVNFSCKNKSTGILKVTDLGFGEFYQGTEKVMEFSIEI